MGKRYLIDLTELPYDAFVADESWLIPMEEDDADGNEGKETEAYGGKETGRDTGQEAAEPERAKACEESPGLPKVAGR